MKKKVSFADPNFRENLHAWMQTINPKPTGAELEALKNKYEEQKAAYIAYRKEAGPLE